MRRQYRDQSLRYTYPLGSWSLEQATDHTSSIVTLATHYQRDALRIATAGGSRGHADIEYRAIRIAQPKIERAVINLLRFLDSPSALVFCNTRDEDRAPVSK